jgi:hypothetical protein
MNISSDPNDPQFREALRRIGAPEWYPQDAPTHRLSGDSEQQEDGTWLSKLTCAECDWERHFTSGIDGGMEVISEGDRWALHMGGTDPEMFRITGVEVTQDDDPALDVFREFLDG